MPNHMVCIAGVLILGLTTFTCNANAFHDDQLKAAIDASNMATFAANEAGARATEATAKLTTHIASATVAAAAANAATVTTDVAGVAAKAAQKVAYDAYHAQPQIQTTVTSSTGTAVSVNNSAKSAAASTAALAETSCYESNQAHDAILNAMQLVATANAAAEAASIAGGAVTIQLEKTPAVLAEQRAAAIAAAATAVASTAVAKAGAVAATNAYIALDPVAIAACMAGAGAADSSRKTALIADSWIQGQ